MGGKSIDGTFDATMLAGDSPEAYNDVMQPNRVVPQNIQVTFSNGTVELPPHSLTIVQCRTPLRGVSEPERN
jgi:alpha-N-arabinofuranosidase